MIAAIGWRDLLMVVLGFGAIPVAIYNPYYGLLAYCWLSFLRPQSMVFSTQIAETRFTFFVGIALVLRSLLSEGPRFRLKAPSVVFIGVWIWMVVCTIMSKQQAESAEFLEKFSKIAIAALLLTGLVHERWQLKWLVIVLALCSGFYAVKIGGYFLLGFSDVTHHGGPAGMDNNDIALFLAMGFPLLVFGAAEVQHKWLRRGMYFAAAMCVPAVIVGESRGGMLALAVSLVITVWRRTNWFKTLVLGAVAIPIILLMLPPGTMERYKSIGNYREDSSARARLGAWAIAREMTADHPVTGVGMGQNAFQIESKQYLVAQGWEFEDPPVAHSVWFSAMAGMGYPGLALFGLLIVVTFWMTWRIRRTVAGLGDGGGWAVSYSKGIETAVIAYAIAGTFLSQVGFEYVYAVMLLSVPLMALAQREVASRSSVEDDLLSAGPDGSEGDRLPCPTP